MGVIYVDEGQDWLKQYDRWKGAKWHKRITKKQIAVLAGVGGFALAAFIFGGKAVMAFFGGFQLFGLF